MVERKAPPLVDLCVQLAIDKIGHIGYVGQTDVHLLERILPHCSKLEQLKHIEDSTEERDLSAITDKLWRKFYEREFGAKSIDLICERMKNKNVSFKWRSLYEARLRSFDRVKDRVKERYEEEDARKQSRQVRITTKVPPSRIKRSFYGEGPGRNISNTKSSIMKKSKLQFLKSHDVRNLAAIKKNGFQKSNAISPMTKRGVLSGHRRP